MTDAEKVARQLANLTAEYEAWQRDNGLKLGPPKAHLEDGELSKAQREWLLRFMKRQKAVARNCVLETILVVENAGEEEGQPRVIGPFPSAAAATRYGVKHFDGDDYYWLPIESPQEPLN